MPKNPTERADEARRAFAALNSKPQPHSVEAEMALIGSCLLGASVLTEMAPIPDEAFYVERHRAIWRALVYTYDTTGTVDLVQLVDRIRDAVGDENAWGGPDYLVELAQGVPSAVNAPHYAEIVREKHRLRKLIDAGSMMVYEAFNAGDRGPGAAAAIADEIGGAVFAVAESSSTEAGPADLAEMLDLELARLSAREGESVGISTGFGDLDEMLSGLHPGEMIIIGARPSMGKTALALNLAEQIALGGTGTKPRPVLVFSLEMNRKAITQRLMSAASGVPSPAIRTNAMSGAQYAALMDSAKRLRGAPITVDDSPSLSIASLRARARRYCLDRSIEVVVVDYLQLLTAPGKDRESRQVEVSAISRGIKALARELGVPVVCLAQLNRLSEMRSSNRPRLSDLRESGSIEQDADVVMLLHREEYYHTEDPEWAAENPTKVGVAELIVAKQRNGPTGVVPLVWDSKATRFRSYAAGAYTGPTEYQPGVGEIPV